MKPTMRILPLKGKYYGTQIEVIDGPCAGMVFKLWHSTGNPSEREGISADELEDEHYESQETYELAKQIVGNFDVACSQYGSRSRGYDTKKEAAKWRGKRVKAR